MRMRRNTSDSFLFVLDRSFHMFRQMLIDLVEKILTFVPRNRITGESIELMVESMIR